MARIKHHKKKKKVIKVPKLKVDKQGRKYILKNKKKVYAPPRLTDKQLIKWILNKVLPKKRKRKTEAPTKEEKGKTRSDLLRGTVNQTTIDQARVIAQHEAENRKTQGELQKLKKAIIKGREREIPEDIAEEIEQREAKAQKHKGKRVKGVEQELKKKREQLQQAKAHHDQEQRKLIKEYMNEFKQQYKLKHKGVKQVGQAIRSKFDKAAKDQLKEIAKSAAHPTEEEIFKASGHWGEWEQNANADLEEIENGLQGEIDRLERRIKSISEEQEEEEEQQEKPKKEEEEAEKEQEKEQEQEFEGAKSKSEQEKEHDKEVEELLGEGKSNDKGLYTDQIDQIMRPYHEYLGTIPSDAISSIVSKVKPRSRGAFVMNLDKHNQPGSHWVGVFFDARPTGSNSIEYYDSFARQPSKEFMKEMKKLAKKLNADTYLKMKVNRIQRQRNSSMTCGYHATKFLIDRFRNKPFAECSGYDDHVKGEKDIEKFRKKEGLEDFKYIGKPYKRKKVVQIGDELDGEGVFGDVANYVKTKVGNVLEAIKGIRTGASPSVRQFLEKNGNAKITSWQVGRAPIMRGVDKFANLLSLGLWNKNKKALGYDDMFHLFIDLTLDNGIKTRMEKNEVVQITPSKAYKTENKQENRQLGPTSKTLAEIFKGAADIQGESNFWIYNAIRANCQMFVRAICQSAGVWNSTIQTFVMQDADKVIEGFSWFEQLAKHATDLANRIDIAKQGRGRRKHRRITKRPVP